MTQSVAKMAVCSASLAVLGVWFGLSLGYYTNAPVSFFITALEGLFYFAALGWHCTREKLQTKETVPIPSSAEA